MYSDEVRAELSRRTRAGLASAKARGVRLGRPSAVPPQVSRRVEQLRRQGATLQAIANKLTAMHEPTPTGKAVWSTSSVQSVLHKIALDQQAYEGLTRQPR